MNNRTGRTGAGENARATGTGCKGTADAEGGYRLAVELANAKRALAESRRQINTVTRKMVSLALANAGLERDVKALTEREALARVNACHDYLTGLPNRRELNDRLRQAMAYALRHQRRLALVLLDLDDFKTVNDRLGHAVGDQVLCLVAARLLRVTRDSDTACRYGGDEFVILLPEIGDTRLVDVIVCKMLAALSEPYRVDGVDIRMTASAGHVIYPVDGAGSDALLAMADQVLYRSKAMHRKVSLSVCGA
jgi:diguanylate cyclase (GGDEF)-like protein